MIFLMLLYITAVISANKAPLYNLREGPQHFEDFIKTHNKVYNSDEEKAMRYEIFLKNLEEINELNSKHEFTQYSVNQFTDLTLQEFQEKHTSLMPSAEHLDRTGCKYMQPEIKNEHEGFNKSIYGINFDWRDRGVVTRVKNQGNCRSGWAFSAVGNVESITAINGYELKELSEQQLVDCAPVGDGCHGGDPYEAIRYLSYEGAMSSATYPYEGGSNHCKYNREQVEVYVVGCKILSGHEVFISDQLVKIGPLSIAIDATPLRHYHSGVLAEENCKYSRINHAVLLVGYGVDNASGLPYWLVKNSWGEHIEEKGYFRMERGVNCLGFGRLGAITAETFKIPRILEETNSSN